MIDNLPVQTAQIYDYLSKGNFLFSNKTSNRSFPRFSVFVIWGIELYMYILNN